MTSSKDSTSFAPRGGRLATRIRRFIVWIERSAGRVALALATAIFLASGVFVIVVYNTRSSAIRRRADADHALVTAQSQDRAEDTTLDQKLAALKGYAQTAQRVLDNETELTAIDGQALSYSVQIKDAGLSGDQGTYNNLVDAFNALTGPRTSTRNTLQSLRTSFWSTVIP